MRLLRSQFFAKAQSEPPSSAKKAAKMEGGVRLLTLLAITGVAVTPMALSLSAGTAVALGLLAFWPWFKLAAAQGAIFADLMQYVRNLDERARKAAIAIGRFSVGFLEIVFGYTFVHPFKGRFGSRRSGWL